MSTTIVVGYDAREPAKRALERAIEEARASNGRLLIVAVLPIPLDPYAPRSFGTLDDSPPPREPRIEPPELRPITDEAMRRARAAGVAADYVWAEGDPARTIVDAARDSGASTIVVGSHQHGFLARLLGQDVAAAVKREARSDVIVVE